MRSSAERTTGSGGWDDDWGDAFPAAPQTPAAAPKPAAYQQMTPQQQPGAAFAYQPPQQLTPQQAYQHEAFPQQKWAAQPVPAPAPAPAPGFMQPQQSVQQPQAPQFACGSGGAGGGGSSVMGLDQAAIAGAAAQAMGVDPGAASAMQQVATGMAMNYLGNTASATTAVASSYLTQLRYYFDVNNSYVTQKLKVLALPFRHKEWERTVGAHGRLQPPALDVNAPDLYLPSMAYITYILVVGFVMGANGTFTPDVLGITASAGLMIVLLEVSIIKLAFYLVHGARIPFLELCSCSGYKFLGANLALGSKHVVCPEAGWAAIALGGASIGTFMAKTLRQSLAAGSGGFTPGFMTEGMGSPGRMEQKKKQNYSLYAVAVAQLPFLWWLCRV
jgi:hypothetical protein